jgi:hypothetical protein
MKSKTLWAVANVMRFEYRSFTWMTKSMALPAVAAPIRTQREISATLGSTLTMYGEEATAELFSVMLSWYEEATVIDNSNE